MYFLSKTLRVCYFSIFLELLHGYLLFAANLEDFHAIAKKLVPEQLASLAKTVAKTPQNRDYDDANEYEKEYDINNKQINKNIERGQNGVKSRKIRLSNDDTIDFEELVERVKKRLEKELQEKYSNTKKLNKFKKKRKTSKVTENIQTNADQSSDYIDEISDRPIKRNPNIHVTVNTEGYEYADASKDDNQKDKIKTKNEKDYVEFKEIEIMKDSYEDYETPAKDANIYSSKENKRFKVKQNSQKPKVLKEKSVIKKEKFKKPASDEDAIEDKERSENIDYDIITQNVKKKLNTGTFKPTRQYKMATPNYVSPKPAERYDFDEPLPERDRERESITYFGNPPAKINKKVRLV